MLWLGIFFLSNPHAATLAQFKGKQELLAYDSCSFSCLTFRGFRPTWDPGLLKDRTLTANELRHMSYCLGYTFTSAVATSPAVAGSTHLVGFTLAHAGAHSIHPQVGVQVIWAQTCVGIHHFCHGHGHCAHAAAARIKEYSITMSQKKPNPSREQHPPHVRRVTQRTLKRKILKMQRL